MGAVFHTAPICSEVLILEKNILENCHCGSDGLHDRRSDLLRRAKAL